MHEHVPKHVADRHVLNRQVPEHVLARHVLGLKKMCSNFLMLKLFSLSSEQHASTQSVRPPRACFQLVVIPIENVVRFSCGLKAHHRNSVRQSVVR